MPKFYINVEEILLHSHGNFEDQSKVLEPPIIIINYCIIFINAYHNCAIHSIISI